METEQLAEGLGFPEGPVVMPDHSIVFCDGNTGQMLRFADGELSQHTRIGGSPWGAILGTDGALYVTNGGNVPGSDDQSATPAVQRILADGTIETLATELAGHPLAGPNDLAFGPDGRLWFTDSGTEMDDRYDERQPGRLYVMDASRAGELLIERPEVYPNGIAFDAHGALYWTESLARRICRLDEDGRAHVFCQLPDTHIPDGMAIAADGRFFVCTTTSGGVSIVSPDGEHLDDVLIGNNATNCIFDGPALYVTATQVDYCEASMRTGSFWRIATDATGPLPLIAGKL